MLNLRNVDLSNNKVLYLNFDGDEPIKVLVRGRIANSTDISERTKPWKQKIVQAIMDKRNGVQNNENHYAISVSMKFHLKTHGNLKLDAENYLKPILDGVAAGLFVPDNTNPSEISHFNYDDSNFDKVYFEKLSHALTFEDEFVIITISQKSI